MTVAGSPLFRRLLGKQLLAARERAGLSQVDAGDRIKRRDSAISRFETGRALVDGLQLEILCQFYGVDTDTENYMMKLWDLSQSTPWWSHLGRRSEAQEALLMLEDAAHQLIQYDLSAIPGLLQTASYAQSIIRAVDMDISTDQVEKGVELRMQRQAKIWHRTHPLEATFLIDENALARIPGSSDVRRAQLVRLINPPESATIRILPFGAGPHPSLASYSIFGLDFDGKEGAMRAVHVEGSAAQQGVIAEDDDEVRRYDLVFERTLKLSLSAKESARKLEEMIRGIEDDD